MARLTKAAVAYAIAVGLVAVAPTLATAIAVCLLVGVASVVFLTMGNATDTQVGHDGFIKLVVDGERSALVGATSAGPACGEVLSMLTLAVHAAVSVQRLREMIYAYPTFHGAVPEAIGRLS